MLNNINYFGNSAMINHTEHYIIINIDNNIDHIIINIDTNNSIVINIM